MSLDPPKAPTVTACRQACGTARAREEQFEAQLERARDEFAKVSAETVADENLDIAAVADAMAAAQNKVDAIEKALRVAKQRRAEAEEVLKAADRDAKREVLRTHLAQLGTLGTQIDDAMTHLTHVVGELIPVLNETRALGFDLVNQQLTSSNLLFKVKLLDSCKSMPGCATGESWFLRPEPWSASLPTPDQADHAR
jgi:chromosome segregation ATPase